MNINQIRSDFPIFNQSNHDKPLVYLDNAATTQKPNSVIQKITDFYRTDNFNVHRSVYTPAQKTTDEYEAVRDKVADFIGSDSRKNIIFTTGTTASLNIVADSYIRSRIEPGDEILISIMEHHSNLLPWMRLAKEKGAQLKYIPVLDDGTLDLAKAKEMINDKTKVVSLTAVSNVLGVINPMEELIQAAHDHNAYFVMDGAQAAPEIPLNVKELNPDFLAFSGHKMLGPTGIGVLYVNSDLLNEMEPSQLGGEMIRSVATDHFTYNDIPLRFEAGTPNIEGVIGLGSAIDYLNTIGMKEIKDRCARLGQYLYDRLDSIDGIDIYGPKKRQTGIVSFNLTDLHAHDIATIMDMNGICVRAGYHCAQPLVNECLNTTATIRASLYFYNTKEECDRLIECVKEAKGFFHES